ELEIDCQSCDGATIVNPKGEIEFKNVHFRYPSRPQQEVLKGVSIKVTIDGIPINTLNIRWLRRTIGVVSQEPILFAATVEENLRLGW
ncbi:unnamed protein product, partial [Gongylonema pulchrum]|uniref:ABC transporter domain-containing protein n=1 Tax=Gongylonema pulchrum TaxID=637853 RepID=A0A183EYV8_9BILA